jgi:ABC-type transport system involved in multi-copper enzyme maturation permease subunit
MSEYVLELERDLANLFAGMLGLIVALMVCASFVPNMLQKGTLETILARPVPRGRLLFYKYLGSLWFVFIMSTALFGVCWMAISVRTGVWNPWFLACILTITANFAVIHCVSVLFGVITRQGAIAGMIGLSFWGISGQVVQTREMMQMSADRGLSKVDPLVQKTLNTCYWILPKTTDFGHLNTLFLSRSALSEDAYQRLYATTLPKIDWAWSMGSTAVFCAVVLSFAILIFKRKDF